jgi:hypothetical protein
MVPYRCDAGCPEIASKLPVNCLDPSPALQDSGERARGCQCQEANVRLERRRDRALVISLSVVVVALVAWLVWPVSDEPAPRERRYRAFTACLLTDAQGLRGELAQAAWAGMQDVSVSERVRVQYLAVSGEQNVDNAVPYFNGLATQNCSVIVAAGEPAVGAMMRGKARFPDIRYVALGPGADESVTTIAATSPETIQTTIASIISQVAPPADSD